MAFKMKGSPFKQVANKKAGKVTNNANTKKANDKLTGNLATDFQAGFDNAPATNNPFDTRNNDRTWKDLHPVEKGAAIGAGLMAVRATASWIKNSKK